MAPVASRTPWRMGRASSHHRELANDEAVSGRDLLVLGA
jgi:hypothetical protein